MGEGRDQRTSGDADTDGRQPPSPSLTHPHSSQTASLAQLVTWSAVLATAAVLLGSCCFPDDRRHAGGRREAEEGGSSVRRRRIDAASDGGRSGSPVFSSFLLYLIRLAESLKP